MTKSALGLNFSMIKAQKLAAKELTLSKFKFLYISSDLSNFDANSKPDMRGSGLP